MGIKLEVPKETTAAPAAELPPLAPVKDGQPVTAAGVTLAVCARVSDPRPDDLRLCRKGVKKDKETGTETVIWRPTSRVLDIARAFAGGLITA